MDIDNLIGYLERLKSEGVDEVKIDQASILESVYTDFRCKEVWLDGYCEGKYIESIEVDIDV